MDGLSPADLISGRPEAAAFLKPARALWARARKGELIETMVQRAADRAGGQYTTAGFAHAVRAEFKNLLTGNPARLRGFTKAEVTAMREIVHGGPIEKGLRLLGKMAVRGPVSGGFNLGAGKIGRAHV